MSPRNGRNPKSPAFQTYPGDFLADPHVAAMTTAEVGAYWLLLCYGWIDGGVQDDHAVLCRLVRMTPREFRRAWVRIGLCWIADGLGRLHNPRQERERAFQRESSARIKAASAAGVAARSGRTDGQPMVNHQSTIGNPPVPVPVPVPDTRYPIPGEKKERAPRAAAAPPDPWAEALSRFVVLDTAVVRSAVAEFVAYRAERKLPKLAARSWVSKFGEFEVHGPDVFAFALRESIANGWQGVFTPKEKRHGDRTWAGTHRRPDGTRAGEVAYGGPDPAVA